MGWDERSTKLETPSQVQVCVMAASGPDFQPEDKNKTGGQTDRGLYSLIRNQWLKDFGVNLGAVVR